MKQKNINLEVKLRRKMNAECLVNKHLPKSGNSICIKKFVKHTYHFAVVANRLPIATWCGDDMKHSKNQVTRFTRY